MPSFRTDLQMIVHGLGSRTLRWRLGSDAADYFITTRVGEGVVILLAVSITIGAVEQAPRKLYRSSPSTIFEKLR